MQTECSWINVQLTQRVELLHYCSALFRAQYTELYSGTAFLPQQELHQVPDCAHNARVAIEKQAGVIELGFNKNFYALTIGWPHCKSASQNVIYCRRNSLKNSLTAWWAPKVHTSSWFSLMTSLFSIPFIAGHKEQTTHQPPAMQREHCIKLTSNQPNFSELAGAATRHPNNYK